MINLEKGQKVAIDSGIQFAFAGLGWDTNKYTGNADFDLDASIFMLNDKGKLSNEKNFVFYNNLTDPAGSVKHSGDNRTGQGDGDDEKIFINFSKIPSDVQKLVVVVTIHQASERGQNFGQVSNAYVRLVKLNSENDTNGTEELRFDLSEDYSVETAVCVAEIYRSNGGWKFAAVGNGYKDGLQKFVSDFQ